MKQEKNSIDEMTYLLGEYDIQEYGEAVFSDDPKAQNGKFRSARSMIPFEHLDKRAKDFEWTLYGENNSEAENGRKMCGIMQITKTLNKADATELFENEAILIGHDNAIPFYRTVELFGDWVAEFIDRCRGEHSYFDLGRDYSGWGLVRVVLTLNIFINPDL
ncbi:MAG: hypothetical protein K2I53_09425 [Lachnospiraceae bacterium]|nr:hypothetical protein [Lachnospiraceae bacterium]